MDKDVGKERRKAGERAAPRRFRAAAMIVSAAVIAASGGATVAYTRAQPMTTEQVAEKIRPSIVGVVQYQKGAVSAYGEGSGIVISSDGYIVTNNHVIDGAYKLEVVTAQGKRYSAKAVGSDARTDLAVVKIAATSLAAAELGDSTKCRVGDQVVAVGNPSGLQLAGSVTSGIISAIDRDIDVGNGPMNLLQTDAAINPGNSGGALADMYGRVIGINSAKIAQAGYEGIGFSIPMASAKPIIESIIKYGYVKDRVKLGLSCRMLDKMTASANHLPSGAYVEYVDPKCGAAAGGVKPDDIITAIDGVNVASTGDLITERDRHKPGEKVVLTVYRRATMNSLLLYVALSEDRGVAASGKPAGW